MGLRIADCGKIVDDPDTALDNTFSLIQKGSANSTRPTPPLIQFEEAKREWGSKCADERIADLFIYLFISRRPDLRILSCMLARENLCEVTIDCNKVNE